MDLPDGGRGERLRLQVEQLVEALTQLGASDADMDALRTGDLKSLSTNLDNLSKVRATVGATTNRLETADSRLQEVEESTTKLLSDVEDADMAKTMVDYSTQQSVYKSALQSGANIVQSSLLDFLR